MNRARLRHVFVLVLGLFYALGVSASVVRSTDMAVKMATASGTGYADDGACAGCGRDGPGMTTTHCDMSACTAPAVAALAQTVFMPVIFARELPSPTLPLLVGWAAPPDPHPPRSGRLG